MQQNNRKDSRKRLIFDTNFIIYYAKQKKFFAIDFLTLNYHCTILDTCLKELEQLLAGKHKARVELMLEKIKELIARKKIKLLEARHRSVDREILALVEEKAVDALASFDKELIKKAKKINPLLIVVQRVEL